MFHPLNLNIMTLHEMAVRLCEGGVIEYGGHFIKAKNVSDLDNPCQVCQMDCVCDMNMVDLCAECDTYTRTKHYLSFSNE